MLDVWLYGTHMGTIEVERRSRMRLTYSADAIERWGLGSPIMTVAQPLTPVTLKPAPTAAIVEGLLPEGDALTRLSTQFGSNADLLAALGRETIGAVVVVRAGESPPVFDDSEEAVALSESDVAARLRGLPLAPLGVSPETDVRISLAGAQAKLPLASVGGELFDPTYSRPSTEILKPEPTTWPGLVDLEAWGLAVMRDSGVPTPDWTVASFEGIKTLIVTRYDRDMNAAPEHRRIHQEDLCMAVGARPFDKYAAGPRAATSLANMAATIYRHSAMPREDLRNFIKVLVANVAIGNRDGHSRNLSLVHAIDGTVRLAPAYDVIPTYHYPSHTRHLAQPINGNVLRPESVTWEHLVAEVQSWGLPGAENELAGAVDVVQTALSRVEIPEGSRELGSLVQQYQRLVGSPERSQATPADRRTGRGLELE